MKTIVPCKNCLDHHIACHASCDKYKAWQIARQPELEARKKSATFAADLATKDIRYRKLGLGLK